MTNNAGTINPVEHDTSLAELHRALAKVQQRVDWKTDSIKVAAGAKYYYRGRTRVTDMKLAEARTIVEAALADGQTRLGSCTIRYYGNPSLVEEYDALAVERDAVLATIREMDEGYTGWSRFFLVTSSTGHIHSSMYCTTCRPTTIFGWLPTLSGRTEAAAVEECGPALCSVCFPSAPTEWTAMKLTKAQATKRTTTI